MSSTREMRLRIRSVGNIAQVTRALEAVSASKVRQATLKVLASRPYGIKSWKVLVHLARQPGHASLHPLLTERSEVKKVLVLMATSDRGLCGAYNINMLRKTLQFIQDSPAPVDLVAIGRKGRDLLLRRRFRVIAEFSDLPSPPDFMDVSAIGRLVVDDFLNGQYDQIYIAYTEFYSLVKQETVIRKLLPLEVVYASGDKAGFNVTHHKSSAVFIYEPDQVELLNQIVPRFTAIQIYQAILSAQASEHAARMIAMRNATDNADELITVLKLQYNKVRQSMITNDLLDIVGGSEALAKSNA